MMDCGGSPCLFAKNPTGQRTNGGCLCMGPELTTQQRLCVRQVLHYLGKDAGEELYKKMVAAKPVTVAKG